MIQNLSVSSVSERSDGASYNIYNVQLFRNSYSLTSTGSIISLHLTRVRKLCDLKWSNCLDQF